MCNLQYGESPIGNRWIELVVQVPDRCVVGNALKERGFVDCGHKPTRSAAVNIIL